MNRDVAAEFRTVFAEYLETCWERSGMRWWLVHDLKTGRYKVVEASLDVRVEADKGGQEYALVCQMMSDEARWLRHMGQLRLFD